MTLMFRLGSLLMNLALTAPLVVDCCLPVTHPLPCHGSKHTDDVTCSSNQQAIAETKATLGIDLSHDYELPIAHHATSAIPIQTRGPAHRVTFYLLPNGDIYLRTGALLI
jgi:hypothetical protein